MFVRGSRCSRAQAAGTSACNTMQHIRSVGSCCRISCDVKLCLPCGARLESVLWGRLPPLSAGSSPMVVTSAHSLRPRKGSGVPNHTPAQQTRYGRQNGRFRYVDVGSALARKVPNDTQRATGAATTTTTTSTMSCIISSPVESASCGMLCAFISPWLEKQAQGTRETCWSNYQRHV